MIFGNRRDTLQRDFSAVKDDLRQLRSDTAVAAKNAVRTGRSSAIEAKEHLNETLRSATIRGRWGVRQARTHITNRPFTAAAAAFGVGLAIGLVFAGSRD